ncbi:MAG: hypothetical protein HQ581_22630 [Planctomycetes bacterium]|nr:hypothetical protein [Planctomycetota bacterium]
MNSLVQFWNEKRGVDPPLEADSPIRRLLNTYVVATLMNVFPRVATKIFARSRGELARLVFSEREGGSFRVLRAMYRFDDARHRGDLLNRLLMQSPAVKAARNRRKIAQRMLRDRLNALPPGSPKLVLAVGGGDGSLESEVIADLADREIYYCGVDRDGRAVAENRRVLQEHDLQKRGFTLVGNIVRRRDVEDVLARASERFSVAFDGVSVAVCQGIIEYLDIGSDTNDALAALLTAIFDCTRAEGSLIISQTDFHDRVRFLERGLSWYMRLRGSDEVAREIEKAGWRISMCEQEPMKLITMCLAAKSEVRHAPLEGESPLGRPHATGQVPSSTSRRRAPTR